MAKTAVPLFPAPSFKFPQPKLPKLDLEALFATQKANLATAQEAQTVLADAAQAIARVQHGYLEQVVSETRADLSRSKPKMPEAVLAEVKAAAERTGVATKQIVDLTVAAQHRVVELATQRGQADVSELKALAA